MGIAASCWSGEPWVGLGKALLGSLMPVCASVPDVCHSLSRAGSAVIEAGRRR